MKYPQLVSMPSEISDWLEEQLEARGIDAVIYTRYVISLLNRDSVDIAYPDQDLNFAHLNQEVRRSGSGRKRFRCFSEWREYAERLKRSAAIECLMSAADQSIGIESLVDELCEKLKEVNNDSSINPAVPGSNQTLDFQNISPQDLARKYYAAFPPLSHRHASQTPSKLVTLIPKCFTSPKKKGARRQNRSSSFDDKLHYKVESDSMKSCNSAKQRLGYFSRSRNDLGYTRSMAKSVERSESMTDWDLFLFKNNTKNKLGHKSDKYIVEEKLALVENNGISKKPTKLEENRNLWHDEDSMNICDDLPVDILELLESPSPMEMMNLANMRNVSNQNFIQCGTNITSSIWTFDADTTMFDNTYNSVLDKDHSETVLGMKFKSLTVGNNSIESIWSNSDVAENETNMFVEQCKRSSANCMDFSSNNLWNTVSGMEKFEKWSEAEYFDEHYLQNVSRSLIKLNHSREESSFMEVVPKSGPNLFNKTSNVTHLLNQSKRSDTEKEEDNLLTSVNSHFRPINSVSSLNDHRNRKQYADGTSFVISGSLDNPNYKRSDSGSQYLESDYGSPKKLLDYKGPIDKSAKSALVPYKKRVVSEREEFFFPGDEEILDNEQKFKSKQPGYDILTLNLPFSDNFANESQEMVSHNKMAKVWSETKCDKCDGGKSLWNSNWAKADLIESPWKVDKEVLENIWNGGEVCSHCLDLNGRRPPLSMQQSQLREDISQDGEQLLSDLSSLQKSYMEQLPTAEISYDISELIAGPKERKRRHSPTIEAAKNAVPVHRGSWSLTSHIKHDRFMQMTSIPVLHSVTL
ncbi:hypothetical protein PPYR_06508 [Photinus pyralis]|uniref:Uncharacterized protein n=1 Tax=Photinus pyralis TaxID=7054 RepID=A0A5N4ATX4_PHOPY|nr:hypothetical protein PPYR_06508 [Photinus pyralis]